MSEPGETCNSEVSIIQTMRAELSLILCQVGLSQMTLAKEKQTSNN